MSQLNIQADPKVYQHIKENGLPPSDVSESLALQLVHTNWLRQYSQIR